MDRLSELPDSLIFKIIGLLRTREVVRTTILSKRWKNLWTTIPYLSFDDGPIFFYRPFPTHDEVRNFVNRALIWWRGSRILKFKIYLCRSVDKSLFSDINLWVRFAKEYEVEKLFLGLQNYCVRLVDEEIDRKVHLYLVPQYLYSCSSLKELSLTGCNFEIHGNVQWCQLKRLEIEGDGVSVTEHVINQVLSGSPQLEVFILSLTLREDEDANENCNMQFRSTSLKELSIHKYSRSLHLHPSTPTELRIWTPNLETLKISGDSYSKCLLMNVSSLTRLTLHFYSPKRYNVDLVFGIDFVGETLSQILPTIQHVEKVTLLGCYVKVLGAVNKKCAHPHLPNVNFLQLFGRFEEYEEIVDGLEMFPELKMLVIDSEGNGIHDGSPICAERFLKFEANLPKSFELQLREVEITLKEGDDSMFPFIEILLKYANKLEKMEIRVTGVMPPSNYLFFASKKLLRMPRSSPNCRVDIIDDWNE